MGARRNVGIVLFDEVETLDFAGPFEVFSLAANGADGAELFTTGIAAQTKRIITARNGLKILPDYDFEDAPRFDVLIVPGGYGAREIEIRNPEMIRWIKKRMDEVEIMASVCTGAFLLAEAGVLRGRPATTHHLQTDRLEREYPEIDVQRNVKFVDAFPVVTSGGISAGIDMSLYIVRKLAGEDAARAVAERMEYDAAPAKPV